MALTQLVAPAEVTAAPEPAATTVPPMTCAAPALTPVIIRLEEAVSSRTAKPGQPLRMALGQPLSLGGTMLPAGTPVIGEVIHAAPGGGAGRAGELSLAARVILIGEHRIALRSLQIGPGAGIDRVGTSAAVGAAIGPLGLFVRGGSIDLPAGAEGRAKLAAAVLLDCAALDASTTPLQGE